MKQFAEIITLILLAVFLLFCFILSVINIFSPQHPRTKEDIDYPETDLFNQD